MIQIQRLIVPLPDCALPETPLICPRFKHSTAFPDGVRSIERVILSLWALEKVKRYNLGTLST